MKYLFKFKTAFLALFVLAIVAAVSAGCGSSDDNFTYNPPTDTGTLRFRFAKPVAAQTTTNLPAATSTLRFDFFTGATPSTPTFNFTESRAFSDQITFNVTPDVRSVIVTALGANQNTLARYQGTFTVIVGSTVDVNLQLLGDIIFQVNATPSSLSEGLNNPVYTAVFTPADSLTQETVPEAQLSFSKVSAPSAGVQVLANGDITVPVNTPAGTVVVKVTYQNGSETLTDTVSFGIITGGIGANNGNAGNAGNAGGFH